VGNATHLWDMRNEVLLREGTTGRLIIDGMVILKLLFKEGSFGGLDCTQLAQDRDRGTE